MNSFLPLLYLTGKPFSAVIKNIFYMSAHASPFPVKRGRLIFCTFPFYVKHTETACISCSVLLRRKVIYHLSKTQFTSAVILERWHSYIKKRNIKKQIVMSSEESGIG